jgi:SAM-dependent methyltransferase
VPPDLQGRIDGLRTIEVDHDFIDQDTLDIVRRGRTSAYPWRGQFSPELIEALLAAYAPAGGLVVDPFVGSGTSLFEAGRQGLRSLGVEVNPAAVQLARMSRFGAFPVEVRIDLLDPADSALDVAFSRNASLADVVARVMDELGDDDYSHDVVATSLMLAMGHASTVTLEGFAAAHTRNKQTIVSLPHTVEQPEVVLGDARLLPLQAGTVDLVVTSPPYINVFNYHQNYRKAMEMLGWQPLTSAPSEMGSNRKHRSNRFLTVVQFCLDITQALSEIRRVLVQDGRAVFVIGRESRVRGARFENGFLLGAIAIEACGFRLERWQERKFRNRFGTTIYEDIVTLQLGPAPAGDAMEVARAIAKLALAEALAQTDGEVRAGVASAIAASDDVLSSPMLAPQEHHLVHLPHWRATTARVA